MERLQGVVQTYAWGKHGHDSVVARLQEGADPAFRISPEETYAELWMGTHPNGPAKIVRDGGVAESLSAWLQAHPEASGDVGQGGELPFLFKVLSVNKALSIQAHPDLALARSLHSKFPDLYKDPNHKPEMAIALTRFEALCQFRALEELCSNVARVPEFRALAGDQAVDQLISSRDSNSLREFFRRFINAEPNTITSSIDSIRERLTVMHRESTLTSIDALVLRLIGQYGADIGCFCPFLLNYITLEPGEAVFLSANEPHAYLAGDCIECMACSDNVVRAGLTPKFIDKSTLCTMLTYQTGPPTIQRGHQRDDVTRIYSPPVPEFQVEVMVVPHEGAYKIQKRKGPSILLVIGGAGLISHESRGIAEVSFGHVLLVGANEEITLQGNPEQGEQLRVCRAFPNEEVAPSTTLSN